MGGRILAGGSALLGAMLAASLAYAGQEHLDAFRAECEKQVYDPPLPCECIVTEAAARLDDNQQAYLYALAIEDEAEINRLNTVVTPDEIAGFDKFMSEITGICQ